MAYLRDDIPKILSEAIATGCGKLYKKNGD